MINVLSVDWDYFLPDATDWDWSHNEENSIFYDFVWETRAGAANLKTGKRACEEYRPNKSLLGGFWENLVTLPPFSLAIAETHGDAYRFLRMIGIKGVRLVNFDAHHDCWWNNMGKSNEVNCGSWVYHAMKNGMIDRYDIHYPPHMKREENIEDGITWPKGDNYDDKVHVYYHGVKKSLPRRFHYIFICRSSCWCPPWADREFLKFVGYWKTYRELWKGKTTCEYALKPRALNLTEARKCAAEWREMLAEHQKILKTRGA
jgi:hypothetical protein